MSSTKPRGFEADRSRRLCDIEDTALAARRRLHPECDVTDAIPCPVTFEKLGSLHVSAKGLLTPITYEVSTTLPRSVHGQTRFVEAEGKFVVELSEATYTDLLRDVGRARFTLGHELGHLWLHADQIVRLSKIPHEVAGMMRGRLNHPHYRDTEWQADAFAAAFLAPAAGLARLDCETELSEHLLQDTYGISIESARYRIDNYRLGRHVRRW